jgi:hypothetical protein
MKTSPPRHSIFCFFVQNPAREVDALNDPVSFLNLSLSQNEHLMAQYKVEEIHFLPLETTTAVQIRTAKQFYIRKWKALSNEIFAEASRVLGEDIVCELSEEISGKIKTMFKEQERRDAALVRPFKVIFNIFV